MGRWRKHYLYPLSLEHNNEKNGANVYLEIQYYLELFVHLFDSRVFPPYLYFDSQYLPSILPHRTTMESCRPAKNSATKHELKLQAESVKMSAYAPPPYTLYILHLVC